MTASAIDGEDSLMSRPTAIVRGSNSATYARPFAYLVSSTEFVAGQDPEITRRRVTIFFDGVASCIQTHGGTVEKFAGDAVMAAFGIPLAHEDDAERAVRAGLGILDLVSDLGLQ